MMLKLFFLVGFVCFAYLYLFGPLTKFLGWEIENESLGVALFIGFLVVLAVLLSLTIQLLIKLNQLLDKPRVKVYIIIKPIILYTTLICVVATILLYYLEYIVSWVEIYLLLKPYFPYILSVYGFLIFLHIIGECPNCTSVYYLTVSTGNEDEIVEYGTKQADDHSNKTFVADSKETTTYGTANRVCDNCGVEYTKRWKLWSRKS